MFDESKKYTLFTLTAWITEKLHSVPDLGRGLTIPPAFCLVSVEECSVNLYSCSSKCFVWSFVGFERQRVGSKTFS